MSEDNQAGAGTKSPGSFNNCPDWGKGGQFVYDPVTKTRNRVAAQPVVEADAGQTHATSSDSAATAPAEGSKTSAASTEAVATAVKTSTKKERNRAN